MKAKEYAAAFIEKVGENWNTDVVTKYVVEFYDLFYQEALAIVRNRGVKLMHGYDAAIKEQNSKWNAMVREINKENRPVKLKEDGFKVILDELKRRSEEKEKANG